MERSKLTRVWDRFFSDFLMPARIDEYVLLLEKALNNGYQTHSLHSFWQLLQQDGLNPDNKYFILRHDIDSDPITAAKIWQVEQNLGVRASYYFRISTLDEKLMRSIDRSGSEASYHYEELASWVKERALRKPANLYLELPTIQENFRNNLNLIRSRTGLPMKTVASHGDFINRQLGIPNWLILADDQFRRQVGIELEAYDQALLRHVSARFIDTLYPVFWKPSDPESVFQAGLRVVYIITHPKHWQATFLTNFKEDFRRLEEGLKYRLGIKNPSVWLPFKK